MLFRSDPGDHPDISSGPPYAAFDVVVMAASAGGIQALIPLLQNLPTGFPAPIVVAVHLPPASRHESKLVSILRRDTWLDVKWAEDRERLLAGTIYVAPQDHSTIIDTETKCLLVSPVKETRERGPAADPLFFSAALAFKRRTLAVILSGVLSDGAAGASMIARAGGRVLAQSVSEAQFADMPKAAMKLSQVGLAFDSTSLAHVVSSLVMIPGVAEWFAIGRAGAGAQLLAA